MDEFLRDVYDAFKFCKVHIVSPSGKASHSGYLSDVSCAMLVTELAARGMKIVHASSDAETKREA